MRLLNYCQSTFPGERMLYNVILIYWTFLMYSTMIRIQHLLSCVPVVMLYATMTHGRMDSNPYIILGFCTEVVLVIDSSYVELIPLCRLCGS